MTDRVTVHHEGAGAPANTTRADHAGYTYRVVPGGGFVRLRSVADSWATLNYNGESLDILLTGNRNDYPVAGGDIQAIYGIAKDARQRGELVPHPYVVPHKWSPGSNTVCPGNRASPPDSPLTWMGIVTACHYQEVPVPPAVSPEFFPALQIVSWCSVTGGVVAVDVHGAVFCEPATLYRGGANGKSYFAGRTAAQIKPGPVPHFYTIVSTTGESYNYPE